ncbi:MAG: hypothetical protein AAF806_23325 [Bacteroidota bacterium]
MDKFLQQFKDHLENQPAPAFDEQDWADMERRLELQHHRTTPRSTNYWAWAAVALLLLTIGSNVLILSKLSQSNQQINRLEAKIDTLTQTKIVFRTDTIYQLVEKQAIANASSDMARKHQIITNGNSNSKTTITRPSLSNQLNTALFNQHLQQVSLSNVFTRKPLFEKPIGLQKYLASNTSNHPKIISTFGEQSTLASEVRNDSTQIEKPVPIYAVLNPTEKNIAPIQRVTPSPLPSSITEVPTLSKQKKSIQQILYPMRPKGVEVGLHYGWGSSLADHHRDQNIKQWEITTQIKFSPSFRLWLAANYMSLDYESSRMGTPYGIPELAPSSDNFEFVEANIDQGIVSVSAGLYYYFQAAKKWQPFIGIGYGWSSMTQHEIAYRFAEPGVTNFDASELRSVIYEKTSNLPFALFSSGVRYQLNDRFSFELAGAYLHRIEDYDNQLTDILSAKLGVSFDF